MTIGGAPSLPPQCARVAVLLGPRQLGSAHTCHLHSKAPRISTLTPLSVYRLATPPCSLSISSHNLNIQQSDWFVPLGAEVAIITVHFMRLTVGERRALGGCDSIFILSRDHT